MSIIRLESICKKFHYNTENEITVLQDINFELNPGDTVAIQGVSGSGKTTLLNIISGIETPTSGKYYFSEEEINYTDKKNLAEFRNKNIGYLLYDLGLISDLSVKDNIALPLFFGGKGMTQAEQDINKACSVTGINNLLYKNIKSLSHADRVRLAITRAIINSPGVILADEPTASVGGKEKIEIIELLISLAGLGKLIIIATHDPEITEMCSVKYSIKDGILNKSIK